jgi:phasin family protein
MAKKKNETENEGYEDEMDAEAEPMNTAPQGADVGIDNVESGLDKTLQTGVKAQRFNKETIHAYGESVAIAGKAIQSINADVSDYLEKSMEHAIATTKAIMSCKSFPEALEIQTNFASQALAGYFGYLAKLSELATASAKESLAPLKDRVEAIADEMQTSKAA